MITKRAERLDPKQQADTFVSLGGVERALLNPDNRIIFGRRGTGKTHLLSFVADSARKRKETAVQLDLRTIGSGSYLYSDQSIGISERVSRLLRDFVAAAHDRLLEEITDPEKRYNLSQLAPLLDGLSDAVREIVVRDEVETTRKTTGGQKSVLEGEASAKLTVAAIGIGTKARSEFEIRDDSSVETLQRGRVRLSVNLGNTHRALADIVSAIGHRIWMLIDEWSAIPEDLQPYLADFIKHVLLPHRLYSVHMAAIEQRSVFRSEDGTIGLELGSDLSADINLDDHLVFDNDPTKSIDFFRQLLFKHVTTVADGQLAADNPNEFVRAAFTQDNAFRELVRACEGVPRDAINILQIAAVKASGSAISVPHVREAAKDWYERDKAAFVLSNREASDLLQWIVAKVIGERKARAFLLQATIKDQTLERLFDERILHIARRSYSAKADPGTRYRVWKIDYGCYVDLINTAAAPVSNLPFEGDNPPAVDAIVPEDDLRAIRRSILDLGEFRARPPTHALIPGPVWE